MNWLGAEFAIAAVSETWLALGKDTGARMVGTASVPFPDDRYRTIALSMAPVPQSRAVLTAAPEGPAHRGGGALPRPHAPGLGSPRAGVDPDDAPGGPWSWT